MKRTVFLMVLGSVHAGLAMAASETSPASQPAATQPTTSAPAVLGADGSPVLAYFGEKELTQAEVDKVIGVPTSGPAMPDDELHQRRQNAVSQFAIRSCYESYLADHPDFVTEEDIAARIDDLAKRLEKAGRKMEDILAQYQMTETDLRDRLSLEILDRKLTEQASSDEKVAAYYDEHKEEFDGTQVTVKHILIRVHPVYGTPADREAAKAKLLAAKEDILAEKVTFNQAMRQLSQDMSSIQKPELGPFTRHGRMVEPFSKAAFALAPDEISDPVKSPFGYHLIQCVSKMAGEAQTFEQAKTVIARMLADQARENMIEQQRAKHPMKILLPYIEPPRQMPPPPPTTRPQATRPAPVPRRPKPRTQPAADRTQPRPLPPGGPTAPPAP